MFQALDQHGRWVLAEDATHDATDLAQRAVGVHRLQQIGHRVLSATTGLLQTVQGSLGLGAVAFGTQAAEPLPLAALPHRVHLQDGDVQGLLDDVLVDADDDALVFFDLPLVTIGGPGDLALEEPGLQGRYDAWARMESK
jgi:hypothetical protein